MFGDFFQYDNSVMRGLSALGDILLLNVIFLLGCLPIITIGTSVTAMYYTIFRMRKNEDGSIWRMFWHSYRENLCQGILIWLLFVSAGIVLFLDYQIISSPQLSFGQAWYILCAVLVILYLFGFLFVFPLLSRFHNSIFCMIRNAFHVAMLHPFQSFWMCILNLFPFGLLLFFPVLFLGTGIFWLLLGFAGITWICAGRMEKIFGELCKVSFDRQNP